MKNGYCQDPPTQLFLLTLFTTHRSYYFITFYSCMTYQARSLLTVALLVLDSTEITSHVIIDTYWSIFQLLKYKITNSWGFYLSLVHTSWRYQQMLKLSLCLSRNSNHGVLRKIIRKIGAWMPNGLKDCIGEIKEITPRKILGSPSLSNTLKSIATLWWQKMILI